jgi:hypothetical protein
LKNINDQNGIKTAQEWINQTLKKIHSKMVELFGVDFTCFKDVRIIKHPELLKQLIQRMRNDLKENGIAYTDTQWTQICEILSKSPVTGFFENLAFYNPKDEVLYINEKMIENHPEKIIFVCAHELSEKLLSTYLPSSLRAHAQALIRMFIETKMTKNTKFHRIWDEYINTVFKSIFKEGCCEAIALQTLRNTGYEIEAASMDKELRVGHSKCINLLFEIDNKRRRQNGVKKSQTYMHTDRHATSAISEEKLIKEALRNLQIIKGVSYYLGYPLAKVILEKYGINGVKLALEEKLPLKAQHFANPQAYLTQLEKPTTVTK